VSSSTKLKLTPEPNYSQNRQSQSDTRVFKFVNDIKKETIDKNEKKRKKNWQSNDHQQRK